MAIYTGDSVRMARFVLIHAEAFGQRLLDLIAFGGFKRHFPPVVIVPHGFDA